MFKKFYARGKEDTDANKHTTMDLFWEPLVVTALSGIRLGA
jgi:hypothetical protein